jgi:hypothetical protein
MTGADKARAASANLVLDTHRVVRDGSVWTCQACGQVWPFPGRVPDDAGPCVVRRWGDQDSIASGETT